jgi:hypothetical protein
LPDAPANVTESIFVVFVTTAQPAPLRRYSVGVTAKRRLNARVKWAMLPNAKSLAS